MTDSKRKKHHPVRLSSLFSKVLPKNFRQKNATISQYQHFFNVQENDAVFSMVEVINVTDETLTVAVPSPALVNYLRLHSQQICQQVAEQFGMQLELKIKVLPESFNPQGDAKKLGPVNHFSKSVCQRIIKSADSLDDADLREAMISLAKTIKDDS